MITDGAVKFWGSGNLPEKLLINYIFFRKRHRRPGGEGRGGKGSEDAGDRQRAVFRQERFEERYGSGGKNGLP